MLVIKLSDFFSMFKDKFGNSELKNCLICNCKDSVDVFGFNYYIENDDLFHVYNFLINCNSCNVKLNLNIKINQLTMFNEFNKLNTNESLIDYLLARIKITINKYCINKITQEGL